MAESLTVQLAYGRERVNLEIPTGLECTVSQLKDLVFKMVGIPPPSQKIIFKGKTLQNCDETLGELKVSKNSKMILLGRKEGESEDQSTKEINRIGRVVDAVEKKMTEIEQELDGIEKGFLQSELIVEACRNLHKRCTGCSEQLMQNTEKLDAVEIPISETMIKRRRKTAIHRVQMLLDKADRLMNRVDECRTK